MLPGDRLVCAFVEPQAAGTRFTEWLPHVTIVPWFRLEDRSERIAEGLGRAVSGIIPFMATAGDEVRFGPRKNRPAQLLKPSNFEPIEQKVRSYLHKKRAWLVDETTKRRRQYMPHVTAQGDMRLQEGQGVHFDRIYIVEQKGDYKEVVAEISLG